MTLGRDVNAQADAFVFLIGTLLILGHSIKVLGLNAKELCEG